MATYRVNAHGTTFKVDSPTDLTDEQVWAAVEPQATAYATEQREMERKTRTEGFVDPRTGERVAPLKVGREGLGQAAREVGESKNIIGKLGTGIGEAAQRTAHGIGNLATGFQLPYNPATAEAREVARETMAGAGPIAQGASIATDVATALPAAGVARVPALARTLGASGARGAAARTAATLGGNAALGAVQSPDDPLMGAGFGAAGGAVGMGAQRLLRGAVNPLVSADARELIEQGIQPTPGQAIGGWAGSAEEKLASIPLAGAIVRRGRERAIREYNEALAGKVAQAARGHPAAEFTAAGERVLPRTTGKGMAGDEGLLALRREIGDVYESVLDKAPPMRIAHAPILSAVDDIVDDPALALSDATAKRVRDYVNKNIIGRGVEIDGKVAKRIESDLGSAAYRYSTATAGEERAFGEALQRLHGSWRESLERSLPPELQERLVGANAAWRGLQPIDRAAATAPSQARGGTYTPKALRQALAAQDKTQADRALREAQLKPVAQTESGMPYDYIASMERAGQTLGDAVPDSGTAGRVLAALGVGSGVLAPASIPGMAAGVLGAGAAYSRIGSQFLTSGVPRAGLKNWLAKNTDLTGDDLAFLTEQVGRAIAQSQQQRPKALDRALTR